MKHLYILLLLIGSSTLTFGQDNPIRIFDKLVNKTWQAEGTWSGGSKFEQKILFTYTLDTNIVIARSRGFINGEQTKRGLRNFGIRKYDELQDKMRFWEYNIFGGVTEGDLFVEDNKLFYEYTEGETSVTDMWEYVNDSTYYFKVGSYDQGKWEKVYLTAQFKAIHYSGEATFLRWKQRLAGTWVAKAWTGELREKWTLGDVGSGLWQSAKYTENGKVVYAATTRMEMVDKDLILYSIIEGSTPKIFKATRFSENQIVFENPDYKNPDKVVYRLTPDKKTYQRTISGTEGGKATLYTFEFKLVEN